MDNKKLEGITLRDVPALPFVFSALLLNLAAVYIGGIWTAKLIKGQLADKEV